MPRVMIRKKVELYAHLREHPEHELVSARGLSARRMYWIRHRETHRQVCDVHGQLVSIGLTNGELESYDRDTSRWRYRLKGER